MRRSPVHVFCYLSIVLNIFYRQAMCKLQTLRFCHWPILPCRFIQWNNSRSLLRCVFPVWTCLHICCRHCRPIFQNRAACRFTNILHRLLLFSRARTLHSRWLYRLSTILHNSLRWCEWIFPFLRLCYFSTRLSKQLRLAIFAYQYRLACCPAISLHTIFRFWIFAEVSFIFLFRPLSILLWIALDRLANGRVHFHFRLVWIFCICRWAPARRVIPHCVRVWFVMILIWRDRVLICLLVFLTCHRKTCFGRIRGCCHRNYRIV